MQVMEISLTNKFVLGTVALIVGIIVCTTAMVPAISDASHITYTNNDPSWVKLSEYDSVSEVPWQTLSFSLDGTSLTIMQDSHRTSGILKDMILFACVGEGNSTQITCIQDGMIKVLSRSSKGPYGSDDIPLYQWTYPLDGTVVTKFGNYFVMSTSSGNGDIFHYGYSTSPISFHYDQVDKIVVPNYDGDIGSFSHGNLWTSMDEVYAVGSFAGAYAVGDRASYRSPSNYYWDSGSGSYKANFSVTDVSVSKNASTDEDKLVSVSWMAEEGFGVTTVSDSNPSTSYIADPSIPTVPVSLIPANDPNYQWSGDWGYTYNSDFNGDGLTIVRYTGSGGAIEIPCEILDSTSNGWRPVTRIGAGEGHPILDNSSIQNNSTVTFEDSGPNIQALFHTINASAFQGCTKLTGMIDISAFDGTLIGDVSSMSIGDYAFMGTGVTSFVDSEYHNIQIGEYAFAGCTSLTTLPDSFDSDDSFSEGAFMNCTSLTSTNPLNIHNASAYCFYGCTSLYNVVTTGTVGAMAFKNCNGIHYLSVLCTTVGYEAFSGCTHVLSEASGGHGNLIITAESVDTRAFFNLGANSSDNLGLLKFDDTGGHSIQWIGDSAFEGANIVGVDLSANTQLTAIWNRAFVNTGISFALLPANLRTIGNGAFQNTDLSGVWVIQENVASIGDDAFAGTDIEYVIDQGQAEISASAFNDAPVKEVLSVYDRAYSCFGSADVSNTIDGDLYLASLSIHVLRKDSLVVVMAVVPLVFMAGMVMFALWAYTRYQNGEA